MLVCALHVGRDHSRSSDGAVDLGRKAENVQEAVHAELLESDL